MGKTNYAVFGILTLSAALFIGGCGGSQQAETTAVEETQKEETTEISAEESLAAENASLEAELEELRKAQEEEVRGFGRGSEEGLNTTTAWKKRSPPMQLISRYDVR